jgi:hypothetical protein
MIDIEIALRLAGPERSGESPRHDYLRSLWHYAGFVPENGVILEIGCYRGDSTLALLCGSHPSVQVFTVDPIFKTGSIHYPDCNNPDGITLSSDFNVLQERLRVAGEKCGCDFLTRFFALPYRSAEMLQEWGHGIFLGDPRARWGSQLDLLLVDGEHSYEALKVDCQWMEHIGVGGHAAFDDWMEPIERAVREYIATRPEWSILHESTRPPEGDMVVTLLRKSEQS